MNDEEDIDMEVSDDFIANYFLNFNPADAESKQNVLSKTNPQTLVGPGYYNVNHDVHERTIPAVKIDRAEANSLMTH